MSYNLTINPQLEQLEQLEVKSIIINSPLEQFEVKSLISIMAPILGYIHITLSNLGLYSLLILFLILSLHLISNNEKKILPSK
jgi:F-type H+-transporting ATPase subunit a